MTQPPADYLSTSGHYNNEQTLPPMARTNAVAQVAPAKKIIFYKSGDPRFGGVKMAINQRTFKSFNALMDDLSHRVPLPFGVRTITTPKGIHCISTLDQLEDGGCYLCSDKKHTMPIGSGATGWKTGPQKNSQPTSALRKVSHDVKQEDSSTTLVHQSPRLPKKVMLVKNGDITTQWPYVLSRRNARSFKTLLDEISEIVHYTVKKLYTLDGKKIDSLQAVLHCPNALVCVGQDAFKPIMKENPRKRSSSEKLPSLPSQSNGNNGSENNEMDFGLKAKKSVIHPRSSLSNRSARLSLSSEKSYPTGLTSSENGAPSVHSCLHSKGGELVNSLVNDDIEKKVHVNKDGSLSVEMKVRFRLLNEETLQWSTQIKKSSLMNNIPCEEFAVSEDNGIEPIENLEASSEMDDSLYPCDADSYVSNLDESESEEARCQNCGNPCKTYDIWKNPMHATQKEVGTMNTWHTHSSCSSTSSHRRIVRKKVASVDSIRTSSSGEEYTKRVVEESSHYMETVENTVEYHSVKKHNCQHGCAQTNTSPGGSPEERGAAANSASSPKDDDTAVSKEVQEGQRSRPESIKSKTSQSPEESQIQVCEVVSSMERTISTSSIKEREEVEDVAACSSTPQSNYSQSIKCSSPDRMKNNLDEVSENDRAISSFSLDSCPKDATAEDDVEKEDEEINETYSVSEKVSSGPSAKGYVSENERSSTGRSYCSKSCDGKSRQSDSDEIHICSAASSSSRTSQRTKRSQNHLDTSSNVSSGSCRKSMPKKKQSKCSLHAEDARSNSRASYCSRSSCEVEKRDSDCHRSHHGSSPHSNVSSFSETAALPATNEESPSSTSKCYSRSTTKISQKGSQLEGDNNSISPCSSFSDCGGKKGDVMVKVSSEATSSRPGNLSESICSKCSQVMETRHDDLRSVSSRVSSYSEVKSKHAETETSRRSDDACSQSSVAPSSKPNRKKASNLCPDVDCSSQASVSDSASMYSLRCPAPPKGRPSSHKKRPVLRKKRSNGASTCTQSESAAEKEHRGMADSQSPETDVMNGAGNKSDCLNKEETSCPKKVQEEAVTGTSANGVDRVIPSSLPNTSPEDVIHEWLRKIPSDALLMKCEMQDDEEGAELAEIPSCSNNQELLNGKSKEEGGKDTEEGEGTAIEKEDGFEATEEEEGEVEAVGQETIEEEPKEEECPEMVAEEKAESSQAGCKLSVLSSQNNHRKDLPDSIQTSVQIMKALLASKNEAKMDRSHSLPEVSPTMGRKLSNSANILITCLAGLQLLDEELNSSNKSSKGLNRPRYAELLNIFQALWVGCASEKSATGSGLQEEDQEKVPSSYKGHNSKDGDFTPMSSSGVDVCSGDGGSREGSVAGVQERALSTEKMDDAKLTEGEGEEARSTKEDVYENEEQEGCSGPLSLCSKHEAGEKLESGGGTNDCQNGHCEKEEEEGKGTDEEEEVEGGSKQDGNAESTETASVANSVQVENQEDKDMEAEDKPTSENIESAETVSVANSIQVENQEDKNTEAEEKPTPENADCSETVSVANSVQVENQEDKNTEAEEKPTPENADCSETASVANSVQVENQEDKNTEAEDKSTSENADCSETASVANSVQVENQEGKDMEAEDKPTSENIESAETVSVANSVQVENQEDKDMEAEDKPTPENADKVTEEASNNEIEPEPTTGEAKEEEELQTDGAEQLVDESEPGAPPSSLVPHQSSVKAALLIQQRSITPDPMWALKLLKKIEKEFMAHYVSAMNDLKVKWNLPDTEEVNMMILELKEEVSRRIQRSIEKELMKIKSRARQKAPRPPDEMQPESKLRVESRRHRLQSIHRMSIYNDRNVNQSNQLEGKDFSGDIDEDSLFSTIRDEDSDQPSEDEYCPCDACVRKKLVARATRSPIAVAANAPVVKAFDLQQILKTNKTNGHKKTSEHDINEEGQVEDTGQAEGEAAGSETSQETGLVEGEEAGETNEQEYQEVREEEEVKEDNAITLMEEVSEKESCEEGERGGGASEEEEAKEDVGKDEEMDGKEAMEEELEEEVIREEEKEEEEEGNVKEEEKEDVAAAEEEAEEEKEVSVKEEEVYVKEEEKEEQQESAELEETEQENDQASAEEEVEENKEVEEEEENIEEEKEEEEENMKEGKEGKEEDPVQEEEVVKEEEQEEMEEGMEEGEEEGGGEGTCEQTNQEEEAKSKVDEERNEGEKDMDEGQEEAQKEGDEEGSKMEDKNDGTAVGPESEEAKTGGESQRDASECAENADDIEGLEREAAGEENEAEGDIQGNDGEEAEKETGPKDDCEPCSETAGVEDEGENQESVEAGTEAEEEGAEDGGEPGQATSRDEEDPATAEEEEGEADKIAQSLRKGSAISFMGNCSQESQKGSEDGEDGEDCKEEENGTNTQDGEAETDADSKPEKMYPDSEEDEEEEEEEEEGGPASAGKGTETKADESRNGNCQDSKKKEEAIDQDDLDF